MDVKDPDSFRDRVSTISEEGKRNWVYPKKPKGNYYNKRTLVSWVLLLFLFGTPWVKINGEPLFMFNIFERKFNIFSQVFWPQDFYLFVIGMIAMIVFIILFTVIFGRIFCGWICPQTIFMEMVFRKIEYWIEGDWGKQKKLANQPWNFEKIRKKTMKHGLFLLISFFIMNVFIQYLVGVDEWMHLVTSAPAENLSGFTAMVIFTLIFYFVFSYFREQVCTVICPYGRLQGVLLDTSSIVIAYDYRRGENRGKFKRREDRKEADKGDCIDCHACVDVCPTGIDIRNGTQLECINCTACIDACDSIMDKVGFDRGLIRFASEDMIKEKKKFTITPRIIAYTSVLGVLVSILFILLGLRTDLDTKILRAAGTLYQKSSDSTYTNVFNYTIINKSNDSVTVDLVPISPETGEIKWVGRQELIIPGGEMINGTFIFQLNKSVMQPNETDVTFEVLKNGKKVEEQEVEFIGPLI